MGVRNGGKDTTDCCFKCRAKHRTSVPLDNHSISPIYVTFHGTNGCIIETFGPFLRINRS